MPRPGTYAYVLQGLQRDVPCEEWHLVYDALVRYHGDDLEAFDRDHDALWDRKRQCMRGRCPRCGTSPVNVRGRQRAGLPSCPEAE